MAELVDASDLKSDAPKGACGFESRSGYNNYYFMEKYIQELIEIYKKNVLKSDSELETIKCLVKNAYRDGFIKGEESILKQ